MADDEELDALRRRRIEELQRQQMAAGQHEVQQAVEQQARAEQDRAAREQLMRQILTLEARERLERLRLARPDQAKQLENQLISLAQSGRLAGKIDDAQFKSILTRLTGEQRDINIRRK
jgi:programmed cell death protein 5